PDHGQVLVESTKRLIQDHFVVPSVSLGDVMNGRSLERYCRQSAASAARARRPVQPGVIKIATDAAANDSEIENADSLNQLIGRALSVVLRRERPHERDHVAWINSAAHKKRRSGSVQTSNDPERDRD